MMIFVHFRSGRHIRRRRFDDEIVESSLGVAAAALASAQKGSLESPTVTVAPVAAIVKVTR